MKNKYYISLLIGTVLLLCSFSMDGGYYGNYGKTPVLMLRSDFEGAIRTLAPKEMELTTRISIQGSNIFIVELYKGVHVINNSDPSHPEPMCFINIPGCVDMAIKGQQLFARSAVDLVAIDISDISTAKVINRVVNTFSELNSSEDSYGEPYKFPEGERPENTVIVAWNNTKNN